MMSKGCYQKDHNGNVQTTSLRSLEFCSEMFRSSCFHSSFRLIGDSGHHRSLDQIIVNTDILGMSLEHCFAHAHTHSHCALR